MAYVKIRSFRRKDRFGNNVEVSFMAEAGQITWIRVCTYLPFKDSKLRSDYYKEEDPQLFEKVRKEEEKHLKNPHVQLITYNQEDEPKPAPVLKADPVAKVPVKPVYKLKNGRRKKETAPEYLARLLNGGK